jgi:glycerol uptake facilitator protein
MVFLKRHDVCCLNFLPFGLIGLIRPHAKPFPFLRPLLMVIQVYYLPLDQRAIFTTCVQAFIISWMIVVFIAGLGGPTTYAANPARDFGPRLMHQLLPIPNKGPSEWEYAWIPVLAPLVGGCIAAGLYRALVELIFPGGLPEGIPDSLN